MKKTEEWKIEYGVSIFETLPSGHPGKKIGEKKFKTEKDMAYFVYKYE